MVKKLLTLLFTSVLAFPLSTVFAPEAGAQDKAAKEASWEGVVIRSSTDKSTRTGRFGLGEDRCVRQLDEMGQSGTRQQNGQRH